MASLTGTVVKTLRTYVNAGMRGQIMRLCPKRSGDLRRSVKISVREKRGGVAIAVALADYHQFVNAQGVPGRLTAVIGKLLINSLTEALQVGAQVYFLELLQAWDLPQQQRLSQDIPNSLRIEFAIFAHVNRGRVST